MDELPKVILTAIVGGIFGGGAVVKLAIGALKNDLRTTFATKDDVNGVGSRVNGLETVAIQARDRADDASDRISVLEERDSQRWERVQEQVIRPLERLTESLEKLNRDQAVLQADVRNLIEQNRNRPQREN